MEVTTTLEPPLLRYIRALGSIDQKEAFAAQVGTTLQYLYQMIAQPAPNPALRLALAIEAETFRTYRRFNTDPVKLTDLLIAKTKVEWTKGGDPTTVLNGQTVWRRLDSLERIVLVNKKNEVLAVEDSHQAAGRVMNPCPSCGRSTLTLDDFVKTHYSATHGPDTSPTRSSSKDARHRRVDVPARGCRQACAAAAPGDAQPRGLALQRVGRARGGFASERHFAACEYAQAVSGRHAQPQSECPIRPRAADAEHRSLTRGELHTPWPPYARRKGSNV